MALKHIGTSYSKKDFQEYITTAKTVTKQANLPNKKTTPTKGTVSKYTPIIGLTEEQYNLKRQIQTSLPEFGSYQYLLDREKEVGAELDKINAQKTLARNARRYVGSGLEVGTEKVSKEYADKVAQDYQNIVDALYQYTRGIKTSGGRIDTQSEIKENQDLATKYGKVESYYRMAGEDNKNKVRGYVAPEYQQKATDVRGSRELATDKVKAAQYYEKNENNIYDKNIFGIAAGNVRMGDIDEKLSKVGYTSFKNTTDDIDAAEIYQALQTKLIAKNKDTFNSENYTQLQSTVATISRYAPQFVNQTLASLGGEAVGGLIGFAFGNPTLGRAIGSGVASADYMYRQVAGSKFVELLQNSDLSVEDAKTLANNSAIAEAAIEFGTDFAVSLAFQSIGATKNAIKNVGKKLIKEGIEGVAKTTTKETAETLTEKAISTLVKKGVSKKGAKIIVNTAKTAGQITLNSLGEGLEEGIQGGMSITTTRNAQQGNVLSVWQIFKESANLSQYTEDDWKQIKESVRSGILIGWASGGARVGAYGVMNKVMNTVSDVNLGSTIKDLRGAQIPIKRAIEYGINSEDKAVRKIATRVYEQNENGIENVSNKDLGALVRKAFEDKYNVFTGTEIVEEAPEPKKTFGEKVKGAVDVVKDAFGISNEQTTSTPTTPSTEGSNINLPKAKQTQVKAPVSTEVSINAPVKTADVQSAIERITSGTATNKDYDMFKPANSKNRQMFEEFTGVKLPATNSETRKYLREYPQNNLNNVVESDIIDKEVPSFEDYKESILKQYPLATDELLREAYNKKYGIGEVNVNNGQRVENYGQNNERKNNEFDTRGVRQLPSEQGSGIVGGRNGGIHEGLYGQLESAGREVQGRKVVVVDGRKISYSPVGSKLLTSKQKYNRNYAKERGVEAVVALGITVDDSFSAAGFNYNGTEIVYNGDSQVFGHEFAHLLKRLFPNAYKKVRDIIYGSFDQQTWKDLVHSYALEYKKAYGYNLVRAEEELICDICGNIYDGQTSIDSIDISGVETAVNEYFDTNYNAPSIDQERITSNELDVSYSLKDSEGNNLTEEQQEFFKDSKVVDENGNLLVVYHGTPNKNVNIFLYDYVGTVGGSLHGYGFYFTDAKNEASLYAQGIGEVKAYYINITSPIYAMSTDLRKRLGELFERLPMYARYALETQFGNLDSAKKYYEEYIDKNKNGVFMSTFARRANLQPEIFNRILGNMGYDGIVYKEDGYANEYVVFKSEQAKQTSNKTPTMSPDVRFSLKKSVEETKALESVGVQIDSESKAVAPAFSLKTWNASNYVQDKETAIKAIMKATGVSNKDAERYINNINSIARMIADDRERLDYDSNLDDSATVLKSNSEYKWTVDMSTLCAKRLITTGTFDAIQKALPYAVLNSDDIVNLRSMMMERGYEVACGICYVESTRRELGTITAEFIERYKLSQKTGKPITRVNSKGEVVELKKTQEQMETTKDKSTDKFVADKNYTPTLAELNTTDIDLVKRDHPLVYEAYLNFMNARGQAKPKLLETRAEYKGEILKHFNNKNAVKSRNGAGGLRVQSYSDFEVAHLIDMMQIVLDMSQVGLMSQAYTKVPAFADVFGGTGMKINLSLIAKDNGLDENGNLIFDDVEGMPHEEAFRLRNKYSNNVGTILVGKNDAHIRAALADPRIDFVIPFHKSSWKESLYDALGLTGYTDYTDFQNEKPFDKDRKIKNFQPSEYWDYSKSGEENAKTYLKMCAEDGRIPKFPQFQNSEGYWKLLIDFKMYDNNGVGSPQTAVRAEFDMESAYEILNNYKGGHRTLPVAQDVVDDFVKQYKDSDKSYISFKLKEKAPTFYSQMGKTIADMKQDKIGANSVVSYLKGRGVKDEEIKWSGIEEFLEGKKSVTKAELQEFVAGSMLQIEETVLEGGESITLEHQHDWRTGEEIKNFDVMRGGELLDTLTWNKSENVWESDELGYTFSSEESIRNHYKVNENGTRWDKYKLKGGKNYREIIFKLPNSKYTNAGMRTHWGGNAEGILAHARVQDMTTKDGEKMLFIEEIQSDWHNEGHRSGYFSKGQKRYKDIQNESADAYREFYDSDIMQSIANRLEKNGYGNVPTIFANLIEGNQFAFDTIVEGVGQLTSEEKVFIENAVKEEAKRSEQLKDAQPNNSVPDAPFRDNYHEYVLKSLIRMAAEQDYDSVGWTPSEIQSERWSDDFAEGYRIEYDQDIPKFLKRYGKKWGAKVGTSKVKGKEVWSMPITDSMKESVLYEGQPRFSLKNPNDEKSAIEEFGNLYGEKYAKLVEEYGAIKKGAQPRVEESETPKRSSQNKYVSQHARTMAESGLLKGEMEDEFKKMVVEGKMSHEVFTDKMAEKGAEARVKFNGFDESVEQFQALVKEGRMNKEDIALGQMLFNLACQNKDTKLAMELAIDLSLAATQFGQNVQAFSMLKKMSPDGQLYYLEKSLQKINRDLLDQYKGKFKEIKIDQKLAEDLLNSKSQEEMNDAVHAIEKNIGEQMPSNFADKLNAWRYLSMLGNTRTHFRNILGNAVFYPAVKIKDYIGATIEKALPKAQRTKSFTKTEDSKDFASKDWEVMKEVVKGNDGKYGLKQGVEEYRKIFNPKWLEALRKFNSNALNTEDEWFLAPYYKSAFAQAMTARGLTSEFLNSGTKEANEQLTSLRKHALEEAQRGTYRDTNAFSELVGNLKFKGKGKASAIGNVFVEGVLPFKKTPANILVRGIEYSPIGVVKSLYDMATKVRKGDMSASKAIDELSAGLVGTAVVGLGYLMCKAGMLVVEPDEDDEVSGYKKMLGAQNYALKIGDHTYTIDWMAPAALPLFVGAEMFNTVDNTEKMSFTALCDALTRISEPALELSCLSGVQSALESIKYAEKNEIVWELLGSMATSYVQQAIPTFGGQFARTIDNTKRNAYYKDKNSNIPEFLNGFIQQAAAKIPGATRLLPEKIDRWGRTEKYGSLPERVLENFVSPGYYSKDQSTLTDKKLLELYEKTGDASILPDVAAKSFKLDGDYLYLSPDEYVEYAKTRGSLSYEYITKFMTELGTNTLSDSKKVEVINSLYKYANAKAKTKVSDYELDTEYQKVEKAKNAGISPDKYYVAYHSAKDFESDKNSKGNSIQYSKSRKEMKAIKKNVKGLSEKSLYKLFEIMGYSENQIKDFRYNLPRK